MANLYALTVGAARLGRDKFLEGILIYSRTMGERVSARRRRASERASWRAHRFCVCVASKSLEFTQVLWVSALLLFKFFKDFFYIT